jgi:hypothetical protein
MTTTSLWDKNFNLVATWEEDEPPIFITRDYVDGTGIAGLFVHKMEVG